MPINSKGVRDSSDDSFIVQMSDRHEQLDSIAIEFANTIQALTGSLGESRQRQLLGYCETLRIIAQELKTIPDPALLSERIYGTLKDVSAAGGFGKQETFLTGYVHSLIYKILSDKYAHLNVVQREKIKKMTAEIMAAGDGDKTMSYTSARGIINDWTIEEMLNFYQIDDLSKRLDFDPKTGESWENE